MLPFHTLNKGKYFVNKVKIASEFDPSADLVLYQGNCLDLLFHVPDNFIKLVVTSPPYNLGKQYENRITMDEYLTQQEKIIKECVRILDDRGSICWQVGNYVDNGKIIPLDTFLYPIFASLQLHLRNRIVWYFGHGLHASKRFSGRYEVILWFTKSNEYTFNLDPVRVPQKYPQKKYFKGPKKGELSGNPLGKNPGDVWEIPNVKANHIEKTIHPCQFPVELIERLVLSMTNEFDWILDPFIGVGTTAIAALMHNRKVIGAEIMPEYVKIAKERIRLAEKGSLSIRPMDRSVYNPDAPKANVPPQIVKLGSNPRQLKLLM
ncbi:MAG: site-specific DNA-methyltransferase [Candidatus Brocadia sp. WS118]|nr:MAG: site-specific DNA-methyltransferase [Candidatus Brocadia sp. WS118]